ncbi:MAG: hypothetical protein Q9202_005297 [Teloschistes flavicans]
MSYISQTQPDQARSPPPHQDWSRRQRGCAASCLQRQVITVYPVHRTMFRVIERRDVYVPEEGEQLEEQKESPLPAKEESPASSTASSPIWGLSSIKPGLFTDKPSSRVELYAGQDGLQLVDLPSDTRSGPMPLYDKCWSLSEESQALRTTAEWMSGAFMAYDYQRFWPPMPRQSLSGEWHEVVGESFEKANAESRDEFDEEEKEPAKKDTEEKAVSDGKRKFVVEKFMSEVHAPGEMESDERLAPSYRGRSRSMDCRSSMPAQMGPWADEVDVEDQIIHPEWRLESSEKPEGLDTHAYGQADGTGETRSNVLLDVGGVEEEEAEEAEAEGDMQYDKGDKEDEDEVDKEDDEDEEEEDEDKEDEDEDEEEEEEEERSGIDEKEAERMVAELLGHYTTLFSQ